jgi:hypothetical protein
MPPTEPSAPSSARLTTEKVRHVMNRWSSDGFFRPRNLGDRAAIDEVVAHSSYAVRLWSEYEERTVSRASKPYPGGSVDDTGAPPDRWAITVRRPEDYEDRTEQVPVPHTERVETCKTCGGMGMTNCANCQGWGKVNCPFCNGKGYREQMVTRTETGPGGTPTTRTETVRDNCTCFGGKVNCTHCAGRGKVTCTGCAGSGKVKTFDLLTVKFHVADRSEVLNTTAVPEEHVRGASGKVRLVEDGERITTFSSVSPEADRQANALLHESHAQTADARLLFQRLRIEEVSVQEVRYRYRNGPAKQLWIFGDEEKVYAPGAPWSGPRLAAVIGAAAAVVAVAVAVVVFLLTRSS